MLKYQLNTKHHKNQHPTEIFMEKIIVEPQFDFKNQLTLHFVDIVGNLGRFQIYENTVKSFFRIMKTNKTLTPEILETHSSVYRQNKKYDQDVFQIKRIPKRADRLLTFNSESVAVYGNEVAGSLDYNAWIMLSLVIKYSSLSESQLEYFKISQNKAISDEDFDLWIFLTKNDAEILKKDLESHFPQIK